MASNGFTRCPHVATIGSISKEDYFKATESRKCLKCDLSVCPLWLCLRENCLFVGCGSSKNKFDHSSEHQREKAHPLQFNLTSQRIWCYVCREEVLFNNDPPFDCSLIDDGICSCKSFHFNEELSSKNQCNKYFEPTIFHLESSTEKDLSAGLVGLCNLGNSCYMNAALQALSNCIPLTSYLLDCFNFLEINSIENASDRRLLFVYWKLIRTMWLKSLNGKRTPIINPSSIAAEIRSINPLFRSSSQQDVQEFLRCFLDELHRQTTIQHFSSRTKHRDESSSSSSEKTESTTDESQYETCESDECEDRTTNKRRLSIKERRQRTDLALAPIKKKRLVGRYSNSIVSSIFDGQLSSEIECLTCHRRSSTLEIFQDLSLPIPSHEQVKKFPSIHPEQTTKNDSWLYWFTSLFENLWWLNNWSPSVTIDDCLQSFFMPDDLTGDNMYKCQKCNKLRNGIKYSKLVQLPEILCLHLKRFRHDSLNCSKICTNVSFPLVDLEMKAFVDSGCESEVDRYDLFCLIVHGGQANSGHYITLSLNIIDGHWYEFDDDKVTQVESSLVQTAQAYVLFYRKKESNFAEIYEQIRGLLCNDEDFLLPFYVSRSWLNRLFYFSEPGPISNGDFLCEHGGVYPSYWKTINDLVCPLPENVWRFLQEKFGGYPLCNVLYPCRLCQLEEEKMKCRQRMEKSVFTELNRRGKETDSIFALSPSWYRRWKDFVSEKTYENPGPISNESISTRKNGVVRLIRRGDDYLQVNESIWKFLHSIYGGGPQLLIRANDQ